jgi:hypothetical protein
MKIAIGKSRSLAQALPTRKCDVSPVAGYQPLTPHALQGAVDMDGCQTSRIGDLLLDHRKLVAVFVGEASNLEPSGDLAR